MLIFNILDLSHNFSQQKHMEFCDFQVVFLWNFVIMYYARRQVLYLPLLPDLPAQAVCEEREAIKKILATTAMMLQT